MIMHRTAAVFGIAFVATVFLPPQVILAVSGEVVAFVSLLMAGLLPAMVLTATVLRGDRFSATRVRNLGVALKAQLYFWAQLFLLAVLAVATLTSAKALAAMPATTLPALGQDFGAPLDIAVRVCVAGSVASTAVIVSRLWAAFRGLRSLLNLTIQMAELQALANDRSLHDDLTARSDRLANRPSPEMSDW